MNRIKKEDRAVFYVNLILVILETVSEATFAETVAGTIYVGKKNGFSGL
ncbi:MAG: hypothetical protein IJJ64_14050 [Butyrivibrio sp.]|nr:hypothetical protein [Butyrivibrio sp.]MBQ6409140.1 hypothetical protein [Butyrivibrio sp.]